MKVTLLKMKSTRLKLTKTSLENNSNPSLKWLQFRSKMIATTFKKVATPLENEKF